MASERDERAFSTRAIQDGDIPPGIGEQPVSTPIWLTNDYLYDSLDHYADVINERRPGYVYGRYGNPTHTALHRVLASLEGADAAWSFSSGMGALHAALTALEVGAGRHLVAQRTLYGGTYALVTDVFQGYGVEASLVPPDPAAVADAIQANTAAVLLETVANPTVRVTDVAAIAAGCRERGVPLLVDNTLPTPYLFRPLEIPGVSLVVHSTSKYIGGHTDVIGGAVAGPAEVTDRARHLATGLGSTAGAFDAYLVLRGVQTLALRLERQCGTALALAEALEGHAKVANVGYSGLRSHPDHQVATRLFEGRGYGAMLALTLDGGYDEASRFADALEVARVGSSFGGLRTEVCHPATTSHRQFSPEDRAAAGIGDGLVRVSIGGEDPEDLLEDFTQAMEKV
jgi:cystathionine beta-lyase/cystathionine gamma-synthase